MKKELDELLCSRYPMLFRDRHGDMRETCMCWGFDCGSGWFDLIDTLCAEIQRHADEIGFEAVARQVKEKHGSLHFYIDGDEYIHHLVWMAEWLSRSVCENCGKPGWMSEGGWLKVRCAEHGGKPPEPLAVPEHLRDDPDFVPVFQLPPIRTARWQFIADALESCLDHDMRHNNMPMVTIDAVIEGDALAFRWHGGDDRGRARAFFRMVEAYSIRVKP